MTTRKKNPTRRKDERFHDAGTGQIISDEQAAIQDPNTFTKERARAKVKVKQALTEFIQERRENGGLPVILLEPDIQTAMIEFAEFVLEKQK